MSHNHTRVAVETGSDWTELTVDRRAEAVRIRADDLRQAQQQSAGLRADAIERGESVAVFLDLEIHIAADARTARREFAGLDAPTVPASIRYVGTPSGLASLISDIAAADVADGVTLLPAGEVDRQYVLVGSQVLPLLEARGTPFDDDAVHAVLGAPPIAPTLAS